MIADAGLPTGESDRVIDVSLVAGTPSFSEVVEIILDALVVEAAIVAEESRSCEPVVALRERLSPAEVSHADLTQLTRSAQVVVRTGEQTPYANIALVAGVPF